MQGEFIQILNLLVAILPIFSVILCRKYFPNKLWMGIILSILSFPIGQFYLRKGLSYVIIIVLFVFLLSIIMKNEVILLATGCSISAVLMILRFKIESIYEIEKIS